MNRGPIDYRAVLEDLELKYAAIAEERKLLEAKESALRTSIASVKRFLELETKEGRALQSPDRPHIPKNAFADDGIIEAAYRYLKFMGTGQGNRELTDGLLKHGFKTESKSPTETIRVSLKQRGRAMGIVFIQSKWWLLEWPHTPQEHESTDEHSVEG